MTHATTEYPLEWVAGIIQKEAYARAGWKCEHCGMEFPEGSTKATTARNRNGKPVILTVHHLNGDKADCRHENLLACCQRCHLHIQAVWKPGDCLPPAWGGAPEWLVKRGLAYKESGQLAMFGG